MGEGRWKMEERRWEKEKKRASSPQPLSSRE